MIRFGLLLVAALALPFGAATAEPAMTFTFTAVGPGAQSSFRDEMKKARAKVREWWGAAFEEPIAVEMDPRRKGASSLLPAWRGERGRMLFDPKTVSEGRSATHHEMIHVYAPNTSRFLAEGLAVYGHDLLGGKPAYPNFGESVDALAARHAKRDVMVALERVGTPDTIETVNPHAYVMAGSFVKFLIERHGMEKFRALYAMTPFAPRGRNPGDPARWAQVYGQDFASLVDAWLAGLPRK